MAYDQKNNAELCVARSTFLKRLARIEELTGLKLQEFSARLYLAMPFALFDQYADQMPG